MALKSIQAAPMPTLICVGTVGGVNKEKSGVTESGMYCKVCINLKATGAGRDQTVYFLFRPEWLNPDFDPNTIIDDYGSSVDFVYRNNIADVARGGNVSLLEGLAGSAQRANELKSRLASLGEVTVDNVVETLTNFFNERPDTLVGYNLRQAEDKIKDENGHVIDRVKTKNYNVDRFFYVTEDSLKRARIRAEKSDGKTVYTADVPF